MIKDLFDVETPLSGQQSNFLKCMVALPGAKRFMNEEPLPCDMAIAQEASEILVNHQDSIDMRALSL